jgi:beta-glucosidase
MTIDARVEALVARMTVAEKIGQLWQIHGAAPEHGELIRQGKVGSVLNVIGDEAVEFQRIAREESRLGIPLIIGRDVIHGFRTIMPIPLGQAASWNPSVARAGARVAAREAASKAIHWTFAPMVDIARDPRWGRIAESCGEDPCLAAAMGAAMVEGFQNSPCETTLHGPRTQRETARQALATPGSIAACAKHYVGYGAAEGGRDYNTTLIPERTLRNVYLPSFQGCVEAGVATLMSAFNDLNDIPASGNAFTLRQVLKAEWAFDGFVVSDWASITEMIAHGYCADEREAALAGLRGGVDMEMVSQSYTTHLEKLLDEGAVPMAWIDDAVRRVLRIKLALGLFDRPVQPEISPAVIFSEAHRAVAKQAALESCVLLKNDGTLPWSGAGRVAVIGPLADAAKEQLGCWVLDGEAADTVTVVAGLRQALGDDRVLFSAGLPAARSTDRSGFPEAVAAAEGADAVVLVLGEDDNLSGEAHSRAFLGLPGAQEALLEAIHATGKPIVAVILAGRPLTIGTLLPKVNALLWAWHPGTMGGPAIADLLLGIAEPVGRLPVTFPRTVGQLPLYYNHKNTGRPPLPEQHGAPEGTPLDPKGFTSRYMDVDFRPEFPFGFGLGYTVFAFGPTQAPASAEAAAGFSAQATVTNTGDRRGATVAQLYLRFPSASATRPVRELKAFRRITLEPGESAEVVFELSMDALAAFGVDMAWGVEARPVQVWIAPDSTCAEVTPARVELR